MVSAVRGKQPAQRERSGRRPPGRLALVRVAGLVVLSAALFAPQRAVAEVATVRQPHTLPPVAVAPATSGEASAPSHVGYRRAAAMTHRDRQPAADTVQGWVMPLSTTYHPRIASRARGSISVGTVTTGYLVRPAEIPVEGPHHRVLSELAGRNTRFTTDELKALLLCTAGRVAKVFPEHKLHLGNFSRRAGGDIPWSVSHNNGRDADIAFYARRPNGQVASPGHLYHYGRDLVAKDSPEPMIFDVAANWELVKGLMTCGPVRPERLFIARWLRKALLDFARASKEPEELRAQVAALLHQPRRAAAHHDHLHIRISCTPDDAAEGCLNAGRAPHGAIGRSASVRRRLPRLRRALRSDNAERRAGAAYLLGLYEDHRAAAALVRALEDPSATVRRRAAQALRWIAPQRVARWLDRAMDDEDSPAVVAAWLDVLDSVGATESLARRLQDPRTLRGPMGRQLIVRQQAASLLTTSGSLSAAQLLVPLLADPLPAVRQAARTSLERITNRSRADLILLASVNVVNLTPTPAEEIALWQRHLAGLPHPASRDEAMLAGFRARGLPVEGIGRGDLTAFAIALGWPSPYRDNAADLIARVLRYRPEVGRGSYATPARFWRPWLMRRRLVKRAMLRETMDAERRGAVAALQPGVAPGAAAHVVQ